MQHQTLSQAYRYCEWITSSHYENFPVASWLLPKEERPAIAAIYAFARSADDFSDEAKYQGRSLELLRVWKETLWACAPAGGDGVPFRTNEALVSHPIFIALSDAIRRRNLSVQLLDDLLTAFTMDVTKRRYATWEELMTYCRYSANPVGRLVLTTFGHSNPELFRLSDCICTALQLANHWQDLSIDFLEKDRLYVPLDMMDRYGVTLENLRRREVTPSFRALMAELVQKARFLFSQGEPLPARVRGRLRLELRLTWLGGSSILNRIVAADYDVFRKRPVLSGWAKLNLLKDALFAR